MSVTSFAILHGGAGVEITLVEYLFRVGLYLFAFGGVAAIVFWGPGVVRAFHSWVLEERGGGENEL